VEAGASLPCITAVRHPHPFHPTILRQWRHGLHHSSPFLPLHPSRLRGRQVQNFVAVHFDLPGLDLADIPPSRSGHAVERSARNCDAAPRTRSALRCTGPHGADTGCWGSAAGPVAYRRPTCRWHAPTPVSASAITPAESAPRCRPRPSYGSAASTSQASHMHVAEPPSYSQSSARSGCR
jgi:hypothetical protein